MGFTGHPRLVTMMATCLRTLAWSFLLCFGIMTLWAMLLAEVVYPIVQAMPDAFADCDYCDVSTRSVMSANLLLFKTVIAGDGWGRVAVPVIQQNPWTAVLFVGSLLTLVFGVLNIIIAVVVDTFAEARQNDVQNLAEEMESDLEKNKKELTQLFTRIETRLEVVPARSLVHPLSLCFFCLGGVRRAQKKWGGGRGYSSQRS